MEIAIIMTLRVTTKQRTTSSEQKMEKDTPHASTANGNENHDWMVKVQGQARNEAHCIVMTECSNKKATARNLAPQMQEQKIHQK